MAKTESNNKRMLGILLAGGMSLASALGGAYLVAPSEGNVGGAYVDPVGIVSSCYGHTGTDIKKGSTYTEHECIVQLMGDLGEADDAVDMVIKVPLTYYQKAALISFTYNVGVGNLRKSTLAKKFNAGDYVGGCNAMTKWVYADGKKLNGLVARREKEKDFCLGKGLPNVSIN